jgi:hypothetical protein
MPQVSRRGFLHTTALGAVASAAYPAAALQVPGGKLGGFTKPIQDLSC